MANHALSSYTQYPQTDRIYTYTTYKQKGSFPKLILNMPKLHSSSITHPTSVKESRRDVDNILDWGLGVNKDYNKDC